MSTDPHSPDFSPVAAVLDFMNTYDRDHDEREEEKSAEALGVYGSDPFDRSMGGTLGPEREDMRP